MCGIVGFVGNASGVGSRIRTTIQSMSYRGPDAMGDFEAPGVHLGMCRLSIVDTKEGMQPLYNEDRSVVVVCNGEIYNHRELREQLQRAGHTFRTGSDCETIVHLYEEYGDALVDRLHGMFVFMLWDTRRNRLLVGRDRVGIKPLYYYSASDGVYFCSEFSLLSKLARRTADLPAKALWSYLCFSFPVITSNTMDSHIQRMPPASILTVENRTLKITSYWQPKYLKDSKSDDACDIDAMQDLFISTLKEHLDCEVPSALMLSGGMDSSCIAAYANQLGYKPLIVSAGYEGDHSCDERSVARETARRFGFHIEEVVLSTKDYFDAFDQLMSHCDEPVADIASIPQWQIFKQVHDMGIKVLHSGLGGDEIFFGYGPWSELGAQYNNHVFPRHFEDDDHSGFYYLPCYQMSRRFLDQALPEETTRFCRGIDSAIARDHSLDRLHDADRIYHLLFETWLPNNCLHLADRLSMGNSIELRVPFLDDRFVDHVQGLPLRDRFIAGECKPLLKRMASQHFSSEFFNRPKRGFTPPPGCYTSLIERHKDVILDGHLASHFFAKGALETMWQNRQFPEIWFRILTFEKWLANLNG